MWIKICGVTRSEDVSTIIRAGADAIGFNFFPASRRFVSIPIASTLTAAARAAARHDTRPDLVGVFVNAEAVAVRDIVQDVGLNVIQIHGDETTEHVAEIHRLCPGIPLIRAFRVDAQNADHTFADIDRLSAIVPLAAVLLDACVPGEFGGTGTTIEPGILHGYLRQPRPRLIVAGGLRPQNVVSIAENPDVWGIDTASGVESSPGVKDSTRVYEFVTAARGATSACDGITDNVRIGKAS